MTWGQHINTLVTQLGQEREPIHRVLEYLHSRAQNMSTAWETLYKILQGWQPTLQRMETDVGTIQGLQGGCSGARTDWLRYALDCNKCKVRAAIVRVLAPDKPTG